LKKISVLGSTGSIGTQTLDIARENKNYIDVVSISGNKNIDLLERQINEFNPKICAVMDKESCERLKARVSCKTKILYGIEGLIEASTIEEIDIVVTAISGMIGLRPTIEAINAGKDIALANKETLVAGGNLVMTFAAKKRVRILPVDSEHGAIFQCLLGNERKNVNKIFLTASGGPFRGKNKFFLENVTVNDALNHPNWSMGKKISIDSATLMNKGLEAIEAKWLFDLSPDKIEVVIHPQSIIHSAVEYIDHSVMAQLSYPDMKLPIQYALFYPERVNSSLKSLNFFELGQLTFEKPDLETFHCLNLAFYAMKIGESMPVVLNMANEIAVDMFLAGKIKFLQIQDIIEKVMSIHEASKINSLEDILSVAEWTKRNIGD
jgi:1-deoxy-D-xylulose-5-phosphate reductoisomerase